MRAYALPQHILVARIKGAVGLAEMRTLLLAGAGRVQTLLALVSVAVERRAEAAQEARRAAMQGHTARHRKLPLCRKGRPGSDQGTSARVVRELRWLVLRGARGVRRRAAR